MQKFFTQTFIQSVIFLFLNISATISSSQKDILIDDHSQGASPFQRSSFERMQFCINLADPSKFLLIDKIIELDKGAYEDSVSWLRRLNPGFSLALYKSHPLYFILETAIANADFEADNAEYILRLSVENKIADSKIEMYRKAATLRARSSKKSVEVALALLTGKYTLEEYIQKHLISYFGYLVRTRTQRFTKNSSDDQLSLENKDLETQALQSSNEAFDLRFEIIRRIFEYMLAQNPPPLCKQLSEKTLTLLRLSPTLLKFFDRTNHFHLNYQDNRLAVEGRNFLICLKKEGKNFLGLEIKDFFEEQQISSQTGNAMLQRLGSSVVTFSPLPEFLCINKFYGSHVKSDKIIGPNIEKNRRKREKQKLKKLKNISNFERLGSSVESNQTNKTIKVPENFPSSKLELEQLKNGKEEANYTEEQQTEKMLEILQDSPEELFSVLSQKVQEPVSIPKTTKGKQKEEKFISDENQLSSSNTSVIANSLQEEEKKRNANKHMNKIWDLFGYNTFQTVSYDDIIKAWSYFNGEESIDVSTGSSHHPIYAFVNGKRKTFGIFKSKQSNGAYGSRYVKVLRGYFTYIGYGEDWLERKGYKRHL